MMTLMRKLTGGCFDSNIPDKFGNEVGAPDTWSLPNNFGPKHQWTERAELLHCAIYAKATNLTLTNTKT